MVIRPFRDADEDAVVALWSRCGLVRPWNDPHKDVDRKRRVQPELFLVGVMDGTIVATAMAGYDGHRGWINYLAVDPSLRRQGLARAMMSEAETRLRAMGCPKINLQIRGDNREAIAFYERIGFKNDDVVSLGKRLERDDRT
jgi:ribosomal protein S18 acetylase RimI-like enzyme